MNIVESKSTDKIDISEYLEFCKSKWRQQNKKKDLMHAFLGMSSEVGELQSCVKKNIGYGREIDVVNVLEELGDLLFFSTMYMSLTDLFSDEKFVKDINEFINRPTIHSNVSEQEMCDETFDLISHVFDIYFMYYSTMEEEQRKEGLKTAMKQLFTSIRAFMCIFDFSFEKLMTANKNKLNIRIKDKPDANLILNRNLDAERESLEKDAVQ